MTSEQLLSMSKPMARLYLALQRQSQHAYRWACSPRTTAEERAAYYEAGLSASAAAFHAYRLPDCADAQAALDRAMKAAEATRVRSSARDTRTAVRQALKYAAAEKRAARAAATMASMI